MRLQLHSLLAFFFMIGCSSDTDTSKVSTQEGGKYSEFPNAPLEGRMSPVVTSIDNKLYVFGGKAFSFDIKTDGAVYDLDKNEWTMLPEWPFGDESVLLSGAGVQGKLFVMYHDKYGLDGSTIHAAAFDPATQEWEELPGPPLYMSQKVRVAALGDKLFVASSSGYREIVAATFDPKNNTWEEVAGDSFYDFGGESAASVGEVAFLYGCHGPMSRVFQSYDAKEDTWKLLAEGPLQRRKDASIAAVGSRLVIWGGISSGCNFNVHYPAEYLSDGAVYNTVTEQWSKIARSPLAERSGHSAASIGNEVFIWGGMDNSTYYSDGAVFDASRNVWLDL